uniref:Erythromycin biosynthesis protein CIII-like C-terminal domain-containing protein n=1 Tax=Rhizochromulina marina TaxID=1034831 RepID=A0A7S2RU56_9STRA|mmetsp:Transcript_2108/g.6076  ORF Transcript_2108/g.6076 Transcript_2108/m.6076 type:complete len:608 (+) Transcript_2108:417-2240(+)
MGLKTHTTEFRQSLNLPKISVVNFELDMTKFVPCAYLWSEALVPRPRDWGPHIEVVGSVFNLDDGTYAPPERLRDFLAASPEPPIYIGFGSMVLDDEGDLDRLVQVIVEAAKVNRTRIVLQSSWANFDPGRYGHLVSSTSFPKSSTRGSGVGGTSAQDASPPSPSSPPIQATHGDGAEPSMTRKPSENASVAFFPFSAAAPGAGAPMHAEASPALVDQDSLVFILSEKCPHDWLFTRCAAVVHHGGASTVAMGLRCGRSTMICPFFGDQFFWAQAVVDAGVGVAACPALHLTAPILVERMQQLKSLSLRQAAVRLSKKLQREDGVEGAVATFYRQIKVSLEFSKFETDMERKRKLKKTQAKAKEDAIHLAREQSTAGPKDQQRPEFLVSTENFFREMITRAKGEATSPQHGSSATLSTDSVSPEAAFAAEDVSGTSDRDRDDEESWPLPSSPMRQGSENIMQHLEGVVSKLAAGGNEELIAADESPPRENEGLEQIREGWNRLKHRFSSASPDRDTAPEDPRVADSESQSPGRSWRVELPSWWPGDNKTEPQTKGEDMQSRPGPGQRNHANPLVHHAEVATTQDRDTKSPTAPLQILADLTSAQELR